MELPPIFDPDTKISRMTLFHVIGGFLVQLFFLSFLPWYFAFLATLIVGIVYEAGQWDVARGIPECHERNNITQPFRPGYGFGIADLIANTIGAVIITLIIWIL